MTLLLPGLACMIYCNIVMKQLFNYAKFDSQWYSRFQAHDPSNYTVSALLSQRSQIKQIISTANVY